MRITDDDARFLCNKLKELSCDVDLGVFNFVFSTDDDLKRMRFFPQESAMKEGVTMKDYIMDDCDTYTDYLMECLPHFSVLIFRIHALIEKAYDLYIDGVVDAPDVIENFDDELDVSEIIKLAHVFDHSKIDENPLDSVLLDSESVEHRVCDAICEDLGDYPKAIEISTGDVVYVEEKMILNTLYVDKQVPINDLEKNIALNVLFNDDDLVPIFVGDDVMTFERSYIPVSCRSLVSMGFNYGDSAPLTQMHSDLIGDVPYSDKKSWDFEISLSELKHQLSSGYVYVAGTKLLLHSLWFKELLKLSQFKTLLKRCKVFYCGYSEDLWDFVFEVGNELKHLGTMVQLLNLTPKVFKLLLVSRCKWNGLFSLFYMFESLLLKYSLDNWKYELWNAFIFLFNEDMYFRLFNKVSQNVYVEFVNSPVDQRVGIDLISKNDGFISGSNSVKFVNLFKEVDRIVEDNVSNKDVLKGINLSRSDVSYQSRVFRLTLYEKLLDCKEDMISGGDMWITASNVGWVSTFKWNMSMFHYVFGEHINFSRVPSLHKLKSLIFVDKYMIIKFRDFIGRVKLRKFDTKIHMVDGASFRIFDRGEFVCLYTSHDQEVDVNVSYGLDWEFDGGGKNIWDDGNICLGASQEESISLGIRLDPNI